jgi:hypothetical protein
MKIKIRIILDFKKKNYCLDYFYFKNHLNDIKIFLRLGNFF